MATTQKPPVPSPEELRHRHKEILDHSDGLQPIDLYNQLREAAGLQNDDVVARLATAGVNITPANIRLQLKQGYYKIIHDLMENDVLSLRSWNAQAPEPDTRAGDPIADPTSAALRHLMFARAGYIEVTPETTALWNEEVLAGFERKYGQNKITPRPTLSDLIRKIAAFQQQEHSLPDIYETITIVPPHLTEKRFCDGINGDVVLDDDERIAVCRALGLTQRQEEQIGEWIDKGVLKVATKKIETGFTRAIVPILNSLRERTPPVTQAKLAESSKGYGKLPGYEKFGETAISSWRVGSGISPSRLRSLVGVLDSIAYDRTRVDEMIEAAGTTRARLFETSQDVLNDVVAHGNTMDLRPTLRRLLATRDVSVLEDDLFAAMNVTERQAVVSASNMANWVYPRQEKQYPSSTQLDAMLQTMSRLSAQQGCQAFSSPQITAVSGMMLLEQQRDASVTTPAEPRPPEPPRPLMEPGKPKTWAVRFGPSVTVAPEFNGSGDATDGLRIR